MTANRCDMASASGAVRINGSAAGRCWPGYGRMSIVTKDVPPPPAKPKLSAGERRARELCREIGDDVIRRRSALACR